MDKQHITNRYNVKMTGDIGRIGYDIAGIEMDNNMDTINLAGAIS